MFCSFRPVLRYVLSLVVRELSFQVGKQPVDWVVNHVPIRCLRIDSVEVIHCVEVLIERIRVAAILCVFFSAKSWSTRFMPKYSGSPFLLCPNP